MISRKIRNVCDTLEAAADAGTLDKGTFATALAVLRAIAGEVAQIEQAEIPDARRHANDPGVVDFCRAHSEREGRKFLSSVGLLPPSGGGPGRGGAA